jgi:hypothetical protein
VDYQSGAEREAQRTPPSASLAQGTTDPGTIWNRESLPVCLVDSRRSAPPSKAEQQHPAQPRAIGHPRELAHNELKIALNRGEIGAHLIGLPERQTVLGIVGKPG